MSDLEKAYLLTTHNISKHRPENPLHTFLLS